MPGVAIGRVHHKSDDATFRDANPGVDFELAPDAVLPSFQMQTVRHQAMDLSQVLVAEQRQDVAGPLEQAVGLDLQFPQRAQGLSRAAPDR